MEADKFNPDDRDVVLVFNPHKDNEELYCNIKLIPHKPEGQKRRGTIHIVGLSKAEYDKLKELINK